jgi:hypothetical protein
MAKINYSGILYGYIIVFLIIISIPAFMIYKYGFKGYLKKKNQNAKKRFERVKNWLTNKKN